LFLQFVTTLSVQMRTGAQIEVDSVVVSRSPGFSGPRGADAHGGQVLARLPHGAGPEGKVSGGSVSGL
jgi:hypothetical protein